MPDKTRLCRDGDPAPIGTVHLGPGAFFRAFGAVYTHDAMQQTGGDWGILAVSLKSPTARDQLAPQDCLFSSVTLGKDGLGVQVISSISDVLVAPEDPGAVVAAMANPAVKIVSLTVTEKGYCHDPATGELNAAHPDVAHDLDTLAAPKSAIGFIVSALAQRQANGSKAFTVLSCDNLPSNGALVRALVLDFAARVSAELAQWISDNVTFPSTMVDRITPATTDEMRERVAQETGAQDPACVAHEAFRQWVIEDDFVDGRPDWDVAGAQMVQSVHAHELMKLRCLNGTHSTLAYLGYLAGFETISDCMADPAYAQMCEKLWATEITPVLEQPDGEDMGAYCAKLAARYSDPSVQHRTWQIAMDGSQKLPQRILGTIRDNLETGHLPLGLCLAVAGWMRYVGGVDDAGDAINVKDPLAAQLKEISDAATDKVAALLAVEDVFGPDAKHDTRLRDAVSAAYARIVQDGARAAVQHYVAQ